MGGTKCHIELHVISVGSWPEGGRSPKEALLDHRSFPRTRQVVISSVTVFLSQGNPFPNVAVAGLLWRIVYEGGGEELGSPGI